MQMKCNKIMLNGKALENNIEIERKFLVNEKLPTFSEGKEIIQAYIFLSEGKEMRIRIQNNICTLSIKVNYAKNIREEFEYNIPMSEGLRLMEIGSEFSPILKTRHIINSNSMIWEIDVFKGENEGLIIAEIELNAIDQEFVIPEWVKREVTDEQKYYNSNLYINPFKKWGLNDSST